MPSSRHRTITAWQIVGAVALVAVSVLIIIGFTKMGNPKVPNAGKELGYVTPPPAPEPLTRLTIPPNATALFFGDSYVHGAGADTEESAFAPQTARNLHWKLHRQYFPGEGFVNGVAYGDTTKRNYAQQFAAVTFEYTPDVVVVQGGLNDFYNKINIGAEENGIKAMVTAVRTRWAHVPIILLGPTNPRGYQLAQYKTVSYALRFEAAQLQTAFIDPGPWFPAKLLPELIGPDKVHPNQKGHDLYARNLVAAIKKLMGSAG